MLGMPAPTLFTAIADPTRRAILEMLKNGGSTAGEVADQFEMSWPAVSRHLRILRQSGLVWETRVGRHRHYEVNAGAVAKIAEWVAQLTGGSQPSRPAAAGRDTGLSREYTS